MHAFADVRQHEMKINMLNHLINTRCKNVYIIVMKLDGP